MPGEPSAMILQDAQAAVYEAAGGTGQVSWHPWSHVLLHTVEDVEAQRARKGEVLGVPAGHRAFDERLAG